jgi:hypothetical protein
MQMINSILDLSIAAALKYHVLYIYIPFKF